MKRIYNYESNRVDEVEATKAAELIGSGEAIALDMPKLTEYERQAKQLHADYEDKVAKIKASEHPTMTADVKEYELKQLRDEYEQATEELAGNYTAWSAEQVATSKEKAARSYVNVTQKDKQLAEQLAARYSLNLAADGQSVVASIADDIRLLSDSERVALQSTIGGLLNQIDDKGDKQAIIDAVRAVRNEDAIAYQIAQQLPVDILDNKRISDIAKDIVANHPSIFGGSSGFTYDEYKATRGGE